MIGSDGERERKRESEKSILLARFDDVDDVFIFSVTKFQ